MSVKPTYPLADVQQQVLVLRRRAFTTTAIETGQDQLGMTVDEMIDFICSRSDTVCFKTMPAHNCPGAMQDVYRWFIPNSQQMAYVKVSLHPDSKIVISFKEM